MEPRLQSGRREEDRPYLFENNLPIHNQSTARNSAVCRTDRRRPTRIRSLSSLDIRSAYQVRNQSPLHTPLPRSVVRRFFDLLQIPRVLALAGFIDRKRRNSVQSLCSSCTVIDMPANEAQSESVNNVGIQRGLGAPSLRESTRLTIVRDYEYKPKLDESSFFRDTRGYLAEYNEDDREVKPLFFIVSHEQVEMMVHGALLKGCQPSFPYHPASDRYIAENTPKDVFIKVREWLYRGVTVRTSIFQELCSESCISQEGLNLAVKLYVLAQRLDCTWLSIMLFDFIATVHVCLGVHPCNQVIGYVFENLEEECGLRYYMGLAFQITFLGEHDKVTTSNREIGSMMAMVPGLLKFVVEMSRGILVRGPGTEIGGLAKLADYPICIFHDHIDGEVGTCYGEGVTIQEVFHHLNDMTATRGVGRADMVGVADGIAQRPQSTLYFIPASQDQSTFMRTQSSLYINDQNRAQGYEPSFRLSQHGSGSMLHPQNGMHPGQLPHGFSCNEGRFVQSQTMPQALFLPIHPARSGETLRFAATQQTQTCSVCRTNITGALQALESSRPVPEQPAPGAPRHISQSTNVVENSSSANQASTSSPGRASSTRLEWDEFAFRPHIGDLPESALSQFCPVRENRENAN